MQLSAAQIAFLQRLVTDKTRRKPEGSISVLLLTEHRLGRRVGRSIEYTDRDFERATQMLVNAGQQLAPLERGASRADMAVRAGVSEKSGASRPHENSVAVKVASGSCSIEGTKINTRPGCYQVLTVQDAALVTADVVLVVENLESLRWIERTTFIDAGGRNVLAVFRGDFQFSNADVKRLLDLRSEAVWAFTDFDPAGLWIAASLPRLARLVLPEQQVLEALVRKAMRFDLYTDHLAQYREVLDGCEYHDVAQAWALMKKLQAGLPQEWMKG